MSQSYRYDPDDPYGSYRKKVSASDRRSAKHNSHRNAPSRVEEFDAAVFNAQNNISEEPQDDFAYQDNDYPYGGY